jgi:sec-independent protein translocase protein TatC
MDDPAMPLTDHLEELRSRLLRSLVALSVAALACYWVIDPLLALLLEPLHAVGGDEVKIIGTGVAEAFFTKIKVAVIAGIFLSSPILFFQIWRFVAPGLYEHERQYVLPFVAFATFFFLAGAAFCYKLVFPTAFAFFLDQYRASGIAPFIRVSEYLAFSSRMLLAFGATFELPVFTFFFARIGLVTHHQMISYWRYALLGVFIVAAVLTPGPDVASQLLMAAPLLVLYVASIGVAKIFGRPRPTE